MTNYNIIYLPLQRELTFQTNHQIDNNAYIQTLSGDIMPIMAQEKPIKMHFQANNIDMTEQELQAMQKFYQEYFLQKFLLKPAYNIRQTITTHELPDGTRTQFTLEGLMDNRHYLTNFADIYINDIYDETAQITSNFQLILSSPPLLNDIIIIHIDFDYIVMFDYGYGLQSFVDYKTKTHKVSFQLNS
jgi:hypothetical protein